MTLYMSGGKIVKASGGKFFSKPGITAAQDWTNRSTAAGVVQALRFTSSGLVSTYTFPDAMAGNVAWNATGGLIGDGCARINVLSTDGANSGAMLLPFNAGQTTDNQVWPGGAGTDIYGQFMFNLGPNRLVIANGTNVSGHSNGWKLNNLGEYRVSPNTSSSRSHPGNELVFEQTTEWYNIMAAYRGLSGGEIQFDLTDGAGIHLQPAVDHGAGVTPNNARYCLYNSGSPSSGCWFFVESQWTCVYFRLRLVNFGGAGTGNQFDMYVARQGETSYTQLFNNRDFQIDSDATLTNGPNGLWLLPYDTNRTSSSVNTYQEYDQVIFSTSPIACPVW